MTRRLPPEMRASDDQRAVVRNEMHDLVDELVDAWPDVDRQSREMGRGFPPSTGGGARGGSELTSVEAQAEAGVFNHGMDPAVAANDALVEFIDARASLLRVARLFRGIVKKESPIGRVNSVEICAGCDGPAPKVKRLDGQPYHHPDPINGVSQPQCWWVAYREKRGVEAG